MNKTFSIWYMAAGYLIPAGIEAHILHYATEMKRRGFDVKVLVFTPLPKERHRFLDALNERRIPVESLFELCRFYAWLRVCLLAVPWFLYVLIKKRIWPDFRGLKRYVFGCESVKTLEKKIRDERPDIIHIFGRLITTAWQVFPKDRTIFHEMMTGTVDEYWTDDELVQFRDFAETITRYFAPGTGVADNVHKEFGIKRDIDVIYTMAPDEISAESVGSPLSVVRCLPPEGRLRFGILGRLVKQKGIKYLLDALVMYKQKYGDVDFTFAGYGELEEMIKDFILEHDLQNVRIVRVDNACSILSKLDVFVHPSIDDAMPVSLAEALMCGVPCVASNVGGIPDLIRDGQEGFVIEPREADEIFFCMSRFKEMAEDEYLKFRERARSRYEKKCFPKEVGEIIEGFYKDIEKKKT